jgi:hypothetical protein
MKTQLKVVALSVLVATSTYAQENKDIKIIQPRQTNTTTRHGCR